MFEKLKKYLEQGKSMLEETFTEPEDDFVAVPEGVTEEQLIEEARQYVEAILVKRPEGKDSTDKESPSVFLKTGDADRKSYEAPIEPESAEPVSPEPLESENTESVSPEPLDTDK